MRMIALVSLIILVTVMVPGTISAAETTQIYPGMEGAPAEVLANMHPTMKGNATIMGFIGECGVGNWHEGQIDTELKSVHISPANSCGKQLVFSLRKSTGRDDPTQITDIWIIGANEVWSKSMDTVYQGERTSQVPLQSVNASKTMEIIATCAGIVLALTVIVFFLAKSRRRSP